MSKVIIFGFPHCGTSILKSIIGHIDDVEEIIDETLIIDKTTTKKYILCKHPCVHYNFFYEKYHEYIKIFIVRNPLYVFSSSNKRYNYNLPENCAVTSYIKTIGRFIQCQDKSKFKNMYTIRYEDLFDNNYQNLKDLLNTIGFEYTDAIFNNTDCYNKIITGVKLQETKPENTNHGEYRTWQINQPFIFSNDMSKIDLTEKQVNDLLNDNGVLQIYPNLKKEWNEYVNKFNGKYAEIIAK